MHYLSFKPDQVIYQTYRIELLAMSIKKQTTKKGRSQKNGHHIARLIFSQVLGRIGALKLITLLN